MNRTIILSSNTAWSIHNFRSGLIRALVENGYQVIAVAPDDEYSHRLGDLGCRFMVLPMDNHGTHPGRDLLLLMRYLRLLHAEQPCVYLGYTVKPNVYGSIAAHLLSIPVVNNIAGLGSTFVERNFLTRVVQALYKCGLHWSDRVFFQNEDDRDLFVKNGLVRAASADRVPGSGVDLARYLPTSPQALSDRCFRFLLVARMLRQKGIGEYVEAARIVRRRFPTVQFQLLGFVEDRNSNAITFDEIRAWEGEGVVHYLGDTDDVLPYLRDADCVVLPSFYREGVPRTLLEAAAMARPIITTNSSGCRDVVEDGVNGYLCEVRSACDLAQKMTQMVGLSPEVRLEMGLAGRRKVESEFDERFVIQKYLDVLRDIENGNTSDRKRERAVLAASRE